MKDVLIALISTIGGMLVGGSVVHVYITKISKKYIRINNNYKKQKNVVNVTGNDNHDIAGGDINGK